MARTNPFRPFTPDEDQMALAPDISGNAINGLNETELRRPQHVYWAPNPDDIPHGAMQRWFYTVDPGHPGFAEERARRQQFLDSALPDIAEAPAQRTGQQWAEELDGLKADRIFDKYGVTRFAADWAYEGVTITFERIVVLAFQHDYDAITHAPEPEAGVEVMRQYSRAAYGAKFLAGRLRDLGWDAKPITGPMAGDITLIPPAIEAGLGELGKHGSMINPEFGSSFRLSAVLTDAPIPLNRRASHHVDEFCMNCRICEDACPPDAIYSQKQIVRGEEKWYVDFDKCLPFFNQHQGCAICIAQCPWSRPGVGFNLAAKLDRKMNRAGVKDQADLSDA